MTETVVNGLGLLVKVVEAVETLAQLAHPLGPLLFIRHHRFHGNQTDTKSYLTGRNREITLRSRLTGATRRRGPRAALAAGSAIAASVRSASPSSVNGT